MELFLTSSVHAVAHDVVRSLDLSRGNKLVFIDTASEPKGEREDLEWQKRDRQKLMDAGFDVTDYTITGKSREQIEADLNDFQYIYMSGGDTFYLLKESQKSEFITVIRELIGEKGKIYIGTSAGSIIAGPKLLEYHGDGQATLENRDAYGLVNFTVVPHWGSDEFRKKYLGGRMEAVYQEEQVPLILLTDTQYAHVQGDKMKIVNVRNK